MGEVVFCKTNDGSVGLYNNKVEDIYHSTYGAYSESYEKFLQASNFLKYINKNNKINILDVCYGIGYNTKAAINEILKFDKNFEVHIDALEYDKNLVNISPLLKQQKIDNSINTFLINNSNIDLTKSVYSILKIFYEMKGIKYINWSNIIIFLLKKLCMVVEKLLKHQNKSILHNIYYDYITARTKNQVKST